MVNLVAKPPIIRAASWFLSHKGQQLLNPDRAMTVLQWMADAGVARVGLPDVQNLPARLGGVPSEIADVTEIDCIVSPGHRVIRARDAQGKGACIAVRVREWNFTCCGVAVLAPQPSERVPDHLDPCLWYYGMGYWWAFWRDGRLFECSVEPKPKASGWVMRVTELLDVRDAFSGVVVRRYAKQPQTVDPDAADLAIVADVRSPRDGFRQAIELLPLSERLKQLERDPDSRLGPGSLARS